MMMMILMTKGKDSTSTCHGYVCSVQRLFFLAERKRDIEKIFRRLKEKKCVEEGRRLETKREKMIKRWRKKRKKWLNIYIVYLVMIVPCL